MDYKQEIEPGMDVNVIKHDCCECEDCKCGCQEGKECTCNEPTITMEAPTLFKRTNQGIIPDENGKPITEIIEVGDKINYADVVNVIKDDSGTKFEIDYFGVKSIIDETAIMSAINKETIDELKKIVNDAIGKYEDYPTEGVLFEDINPILRNTEVMGVLLEMILWNVNNPEVDYFVCPESRGFIFGSMLSVVLSKPMLLARKLGKLPGEKHTVTFKTEYSEDTLEMQAVDLTGKKVWFIDDVYATGGTYFACKELVEKCNGTLVGGTVVKSVLDKHPEEVRPVL